LPGAALIWKLTLPKKIYHFDCIVGASPAFLIVNSAPLDVYEISPAVTFQFSSSAPPVVKSWVYVEDERAMSAGQDFLVGSQDVEVWARVCGVVRRMRERERGRRGMCGICMMDDERIVK
jgi:hypothetical protein